MVAHPSKFDPPKRTRLELRDLSNAGDRATQITPSERVAAMILIAINGVNDPEFDRLNWAVDLAQDLDALVAAHMGAR